jgi:hypothetical protein
MILSGEIYQQTFPCLVVEARQVAFRALGAPHLPEISHPTHSVPIGWSRTLPRPDIVNDEKPLFLSQTSYFSFSLFPLHFLEPPHVRVTFHLHHSQLTWFAFSIILTTRPTGQMFLDSHISKDHGLKFEYPLSPHAGS